MKLDDWLQQRLAQRHAQQRYRERRVSDAHDTALDFASNDYLGFSHHPALIEACARAARDHGIGAKASPLVNGHGVLQQRLEQRLAEWLGRERVLLFPSGFQANLAVLDALSGRGDVCLHDRLNHASLLDGTRLSGARLMRYRHGDPGDLTTLLERLAPEQRRLIISDGVFSMEGDHAPLAELVAIGQRYQAPLIIDDAHGVGVCGRAGAGLCADYGQHEVAVVVGTFSKALGGQGAFVAGSQRLIDSMIQFARPYIYSTGLSPLHAATAAQAVALCIEEPQHRARLQQNITYWRAQAQAAGLALLPSISPIQGIMLKDEATTLQVAAQLAQAGIQVGAMRPPTVPAGSCRLRITLSARHEPSAIDTLISTIRHCLPKTCDPLTQAPHSACP